MALFSRKKTEDANVPPEVADYYQAEKRERAWVAWLLAAGTLLVTVIVVLGLFYGGRWGYRKLRHQPKPTPVAVDTQTATTPNAPSSTPPTPSSPSGSSNTPTGTAAPTPPSTPTTPQTSSTTTPSKAGTPASNASNSTDLPNTGPGDTVAIFLAVSALAYMLHRRFLANG